MVKSRLKKKHTPPRKAGGVVQPEKGKKRKTWWVYRKKNLLEIRGREMGVPRFRTEQTRAFRFTWSESLHVSKCLRIIMKLHLLTIG